MYRQLKKLTYSFAVLSLIHTISLEATSLRDSIEQAINTNPDIIAEHYNKKENRLNIDREEGDYYPTLDFQTFIEDSRTINDYEDTTTDTDAKKDGWMECYLKI